MSESNTAIPTYRRQDGSIVTGADEINLFGDTDNFQTGAGLISIYETGDRASITYLGGLGNDVTRPAAAGQRDVNESINSIQLDYEEWNHIEKWSQTVSMRIDRFHSFWRGSQSSACRWLQRFRHNYNHDRPNQALDNQTPVEAMLN